jgi:hypothetical protein
MYIGMYSPGQANSISPFTPSPIWRGLFLLIWESLKDITIRRDIVKTEDEKTSDGLNEIFEIINAKGDTGELKEIIQKSDEQIM